MKQGELFERVEPAVEPSIPDAERELAARVPSFVRFGTSSWSFPGWGSAMWRGSPSETDLARSGLRAYAQHPLFRTVGLDRSYYGPLREGDLAGYASQLAVAHEQCPGLPTFKIVSKVWDELTTAVFPKHPRYGARAGTVNPMFLNVERFLTEVLEPYRRGFAAHTGPFVFELTPMPNGALDEVALASKVDAFLERLPPGFDWAFELRNAELLGRRWLDTLRAYGAAHVFTYWTAMPSLRSQLRAGKHGARFMVARLMLPPMTRYATRKADLAPFNRVVSPQDEMREDVVALLRAAAEADCEDAFVLVNNKAEGSAPLTVRALAERTAAAFGT